MTGTDVQVEILLAQTNEALRQQSLAFDERLRQEGKWAPIRFAMGWCAVAIFPSILVVAGFIVFQHDEFDASTVSLAAAALLVDALATGASFYRIVLGSQPRTGLVPVTSVPSAPSTK
jgi:hypothetical protein